MDYKYRGTFVISAENTRIIPGKGYEVYHCDRVRSLLDDINKKGKNMYAKIQEIQFPDDLNWNITFTEWSPTSIASKGGINADINKLTDSVTKMYELTPSSLEPPTFLQDWVTDWKTQIDTFAKGASLGGYGEIVGGNMKLEYSPSSKRMALLYYCDVSASDLVPKEYEDIAKSLNCPGAQYHIEFGTGLQYRFGLPAMIGRDFEELYREYPAEPNYRPQKTLALDGVDESSEDYGKYKQQALAEWKTYVQTQRDIRSRIMGYNVRLVRDKVPDEFPNLKDICFDGNGEPKQKNWDLWIFDGGVVKRDQAVTQPPHYLYFSHADLCGNSLNLQRSTCLCDYPQGTVYDSRDEYLYVHNCSPFPNITFTAYTPKAVARDGAIEYEKYLYYPQQFYVIIDYYEG